MGVFGLPLQQRNDTCHGTGKAGWHFESMFLDHKQKQVQVLGQGEQEATQKANRIGKTKVWVCGCPLDEDFDFREGRIGQGTVFYWRLFFFAWVVQNVIE